MATVLPRRTWLVPKEKLAHTTCTRRRTRAVPKACQEDVRTTTFYEEIPSLAPSLSTTTTTSFFFLGGAGWRLLLLLWPNSFIKVVVGKKTFPRLLLCKEILHKSSPWKSLSPRLLFMKKFLHCPPPLHHYYYFVFFLRGGGLTTTTTFMTKFLHKSSPWKSLSPRLLFMKKFLHWPPPLHHYYYFVFFFKGGGWRLLLLLWPNSFIKVVVGKKTFPRLLLCKEILHKSSPWKSLSPRLLLCKEILHKSSQVVPESLSPHDYFYVKKSFIKVAPESLSPHDYFYVKKSLIKVVPESLSPHDYFYVKKSFIKVVPESLSPTTTFSGALPQTEGQVRKIRVRQSIPTSGFPSSGFALTLCPYAFV